MFYTPKPKQFHYKPRFYDPKKEELENLQSKYASHDEAETSDNNINSKPNTTDSTANSVSPDADLDYFQRRVRDMDREERIRNQKITLADLFRKREKPQFHYVSRFDSEGNIKEAPERPTSENAVERRIKRRFEDDDMDGLKLVPAGKIMVYGLIVFALLIFIFW